MKKFSCLLNFLDYSDYQWEIGKIRCTPFLSPKISDHKLSHWNIKVYNFYLCYRNIWFPCHVRFIRLMTVLAQSSLFWLHKGPPLSRNVIIVRPREMTAQIWAATMYKSSLRNCGVWEYDARPESKHKQKDFTV